MSFKTFTRVRAGKAAAKKILVEMHEVPESEFSFVEVPQDDRFGIRVVFAVRPDDLVLADLVNAGFAWEAPEVPKEEPAILDMGEAGDATPYPAPSPALAEELDALGVEPKAKASGYVAEKSTSVGPTKRVWAIADSMPGAKRKDVIEACRAEGIAFGTARTQYQKWHTANKAG
jgi:NDP-sugar pyrophosphorylase family protein